MVDLHARAGIDSLGKYRSFDQDKVDRALNQLGREVVVPAVDRYLYRMVRDELSAELDVERDNRSVTSSEWAQDGIARYGCPVHTARHGLTVEYTVSGKGPCSCSASEKRKWETREWSAAGSKVQNGYDRQHRSIHRQGPADDGSGDDDRGTALSERGRKSALRGRSRPFDSLHYRNAIRSVYGSIGGQERRRKPWSIAKVVEKAIDMRSYSGAPSFASNRMVIDTGTRHAESIALGKRGFDPYVFGRRVQHGLLAPKTRLVWMAPLATTIVGTRFSKPVLQNLERRRPFVWGLHNVEKGAILGEMEARFEYIYSLDFSKFDATVPAKMIDDAFRVVRTHLELDEADQALFTRYVNDFIHSRIIAPDGEVYQKHRGVPSGSAFTSIIGSIVNLILISYMWNKCTGTMLDHDRVLIMGDDVVVASHTRLEMSQLATAASELGFELSVEKSTITKTRHKSVGYFDNRTHFLGHTWVFGIPHRPVEELVKRMAFPERHAARSKSLSLTRLKEYSGSCYEGHHEILRRIFRNPGTLEACFVLLDKLSRAVEEDGEVRVSAKDLPGQSRLRLQVEGREYDEVVTKGLVNLLYGFML
nr:hypothetical protein [Kummerowia striata partitivirus]